MKVAGAVVASIMLAMSGPTGAGQVAKCDACASHGLSQAVVMETFRTLRGLNAKLTKGEAKATDVQAAVTGLRILFAHLDETGATKAMEQTLLDKEDYIIKYAPARVDAERIVQRHKLFGVNHTVSEQMQLLENLTVNDRVRLLDAVRVGGMRKAVYDRVVTHYEDLGTKLSKAERSGKAFEYRQVSVADCDVLSQAASVLAVACVFGCEPCCLAGAILYMEYEMCKIKEAPAPKAPPAN